MSFPHSWTVPSEILIIPSPIALFLEFYFIFVCYRILIQVNAFQYTSIYFHVAVWFGDFFAILFFLKSGNVNLPEF